MFSAHVLEWDHRGGQRMECEHTMSGKKELRWEQARVNFCPRARSTGRRGRLTFCWLYDRKRQPGLLSAYPPGFRHLFKERAHTAGIRRVVGYRRAPDVTRTPAATIFSNSSRVTSNSLTLCTSRGTHQDFSNVWSLQSKQTKVLKENESNNLCYNLVKCSLEWQTIFATAIPSTYRSSI
jgi:hypothetical protein